MSAVVLFIIFVVCLVIAIPVSISLGIVSVLPGAVDPSFTASATYVIRSMLGVNTVTFILCLICPFVHIFQRKTKINRNTLFHPTQPPS